MLPLDILAAAVPEPRATLAAEWSEPLTATAGFRTLANLSILRCKISAPWSGKFGVRTGG